MLRFVYSIVLGLTLGGVISLISLGLVLAFRATHTFNFAHGQFMFMPALILAYSQTKGVSLVKGLAIAIVVSLLFMVIFYQVVLRRAVGQNLMMGIIATLGLAFFIDGALGMTIPSVGYSLVIPGVPQGIFRIAGVNVSQASLTNAGVTLVLAIAVISVLRFTTLGIRVRASGQNALLASQCGIPIRRLHLGSWIVAVILAGVAGVSYGSVTQIDQGIIGLGLLALPAVVLGGMDSIEGSVIAGVILGLVISFTQMYLGGDYQDLVAYTVLLVVLLVKPQGIFGSKSVVRA